jgi:hypothetical protein
MKIRNLIVFGLIALLIGISSCRDDFDYDIASKELSFSSDTLHLDTIFSNTGSQTYKLVVHNRENKDIQIPRIYLNNGETSLFKINVDGLSGAAFENIVVHKKDSIFIFVEIAAGEIPVNTAYEDEIYFETQVGVQQVKLLSYLERALFYNTEQSDDFPIGNDNWDNQYSRVIFGKVNAEHLNISAGTKIYFHSNAELIVNGNLNVSGTMNQKVIFRTDRMDERSDSLPNTWGKIHLKNNAAASIDHAIIKGANIGLEVENSNLDISNTLILNNEFVGLYGHGNSTVINGKNLVINNSNTASLGVEGGSYEFIHSTFANYHNIGQGSGSNYSLILSNDGAPLIKADFFNCILYGRAMNAIHFDNQGGTFNHNFKNNVIRIDAPGELPGIDTSNITDQDPMFRNPGFGKNDVRLLVDSPVLGTGEPIYANMVPFDLLGQSRTNSPTPGAYQLAVEPEVD